MNGKTKSFLYVFITILLWGTVAATVALLLKNLDYMQTLLFISFFATLALFVVVLFGKKFSIIKKYTFQDYVHFAGMGFVGMFLYSIFFYASLTLLSAQEAFIINYTWPIWIIIFAVIFLKEKLNYKTILALLLSFAGVYIIATGGTLYTFSSSSFLGIFLALAGAICYGLFSVLGKKKDYERYTSMMFYQLFAFIFALIGLFLFSSFPSISLYELAGLIWVGAFATGLAFTFWFLALKHGDTAKISMLTFLTPFVSLVFIVLLLGEQILVSSIVGLLLIVGGILLVSLKGKHL